MKALTIRQPWAWAVIHGGKTVENRQQRFTYRGPLAIHAALTGDHTAYTDPALTGAIQRLKPATAAMPFGAVIGVVDITDCHTGCGPAGCSPWARDVAAHITLANPRPLPAPIPARGMLGLWTLPADIHEAIRLQLGGAA